jgi:hypothetical protein
MTAATYSPTWPPSVRGGPKEEAMQRMGNCVAARATAYKRKPAKANLAGFLTNNAGSDLLSHAAASVRGGPKKGSHAAHGKLCGCTSDRVQAKAREANLAGFLTNNAGSDLLSHAVSHAVPSAVSGLTSVFGMGTGVTLIL